MIDPEINIDYSRIGGALGITPLNEKLDHLSALLDNAEPTKRLKYPPVLHIHEPPSLIDNIRVHRSLLHDREGIKIAVCGTGGEFGQMVGIMSRIQKEAERRHVVIDSIALAEDMMQSHRGIALNSPSLRSKSFLYQENMIEKLKEDYDRLLPDMDKKIDWRDEEGNKRLSSTKVGRSEKAITKRRKKNKIARKSRKKSR